MEGENKEMKTAMETAMISVIGETIEEHFEDLDFIEVVRTSEEIFDRLSKFMEFKPFNKGARRNIIMELEEDG